jgi:dihydrofolate reductase
MVNYLDVPDLKYFQEMTKEGVVIMGKNTYMSIPENLDI